MKKKILFVMPKFAPGGAEKSLLMLLRFLSNTQKYDIDLMLFKKEGAFINELPKSVNLLETETSLKLLYSPFNINNIHSFNDLKISCSRILDTFLSGINSKNKNERSQVRWKAYKKNLNSLTKHYDIACGYLDGESIYYIVDKVNATKKIGWNQNDYVKLGFDPNFDRNYFSQLDNIVTLSDECINILLRVFPEEKEKTVLIPPIVSHDYIEECANQYQPKEFSDYYGLKLVSVGRLVHQKGFDLAIQAAKLMVENNVDFRWIIIGDGEEKNQLNSLIEKYSLRGFVKLIGENSNPYPYIKSCNIFVQTSRFEGKSVILNEAKMLCKPIIITNYPTAKDQISDGLNGLICDMSPSGISNAIQGLAGDRNLQQKFCDALTNELEDPNLVGEKYVSLFEK